MSEKRILLAVANSELREEYRQAFGEPWQAAVASTGTEANAAIEKQGCDVLVADLDLPDLDGAELVNETRKKYPNALLFILASEADKERVMKNVLGAHQFLAKPCDKDTLKNAIERASTLDSWIGNAKMRELVSRIRTFPTVPTLYLEVLSALRSPDSTTEQVGTIIAKDMAMMTKLLQVLNSACFGLPRRISNPAEAVGILGFEAVKSMVMTIKLLNQYDKIKPVYFSIDRLWRHSTEVARASKQLVLLQTDDSVMAETAFTAGLMHDLGKIVLAANFDEQYRGAQSLARKQQLPLYEVEREIFGAGHGEIGAYLLGLWGMPLDLLEVAAYHHHPSRVPKKEFSVLTAVHCANAFQYERHPDTDGTIVSKVDEAYLSEIGMLERLSVWREGKEAKGEKKKAAVTKPETNAKSESKPGAKPVRASMEVKSHPIPTQPKRQPLQPAPAPVAAERSGFPKQWIFAGVGVVIALLVIGWFVFSKSSSNKLASGDPVVARARETAPQTPANTAPAPAAQGFSFSDIKLQGVFYSETHPTAIINGKIVQPKDKIAGVTVVEIGPSTVTVEHDKERQVLVFKDTGSN